MVSHYGKLLSLISLFTSVVGVLEFIEENDLSSYQKLKDVIYWNKYNILNLFLTCTWWKKWSNVVNDILLVRVCNDKLESMRDYGWDALLKAKY